MPLTSDGVFTPPIILKDYGWRAGNVEPSQQDFKVVTSLMIVRLFYGTDSELCIPLPYSRNVRLKSESLLRAVEQKSGPEAKALLGL